MHVYMCVYMHIWPHVFELLALSCYGLIYALLVIIISHYKTEQAYPVYWIAYGNWFSWRWRYIPVLLGCLWKLVVSLQVGQRPVFPVALEKKLYRCLQGLGLQGHLHSPSLYICIHRNYYYSGIRIKFLTLCRGLPLKFYRNSKQRKLKEIVMNPVRASVNWLKIAWATQPVLVLSCVLGALGEQKKSYLNLVCGVRYLEASTQTGPLFVAFGPGVQKGEKERLNWPTHYKRSRFLVHICVCMSAMCQQICVHVSTYMYWTCYTVHVCSCFTSVCTDCDYVFNLHAPFHTHRITWTTFWDLVRTLAQATILCTLYVIV